MRVGQAWEAITRKSMWSCVQDVKRHVSTCGQYMSRYNTAPPFSKWSQNLDLRYVLLADPSTFGAGGPNQNTSRIQY